MNAPMNPHTSLSWLASRVEKGRSGPFCEITLITPEIAERLLEQNPDNRKLSERQINELCNDIVNGRWRLNGESIVVSIEGLLNDGQNRLTAIARCGVPVPSVIVFGIERDARDTTDLGRVRRLADFQTMSGVTNASSSAAIVLLHQLYMRGAYARSTPDTIPLSKPALRELYNANKEAYDLATHVAASNGKQMRALGKSSVGAAYMIIREQNKLDVDTFFDGLATGAGLTRGSPILAVRNRLLAAKRMFSHEKLELLLRAWNMWREGRVVASAPPLLGVYPKVLP